MIYFKVKGRLGNQIFQIAFLEIIRFKFNIKYYLDFSEPSSSFFKLFDFNKGLFSLVPRQFVKKYIDLIGGNNVKVNSCLDEYEFSESYNNSILEGYFQNGQKLKEYKLYLLNVFQIRKSVNDFFLHTYKNIVISKSTIVVHRRLGDYKST